MGHESLIYIPTILQSDFAIVQNRMENNFRVVQAHAGMQSTLSLECDGGIMFFVPLLFLYFLFTNSLIFLGDVS